MCRRVLRDRKINKLANVDCRFFVVKAQFSRKYTFAIGHATRIISVLVRARIPG